MARKPNPISKKEISNMISKIKSLGEIEIKYAIDCKKLSFHVFNITGEYISATTLKRFFGFTKSGFAPSYDTIRILNKYSEHFNVKTKIFNPSDFIVNFFEPLHFEKIKTEDKSFQAACRIIALQLKENTSLLEEVMEPLAKSENGRRFYYDLFADYDLLAATQYRGYECYLHHETSYEGKIFANCILFLKAFFENNTKLMKLQWEEVSSLFIKNKNLHPFVLGRYYQTQLISQFQFNNKNVKNLIKEVFKIESKIPRNATGLFRDFPGFHYFVCDGLWHIKEYEALLKLSRIALVDFKKNEEFVWKGYYGQLYLYQCLALVNLDNKKEAKKLLRHIQPEGFYFPTKKYFESLFEHLVDKLN